jgi:CRP-like cAMP-binding protein
VATEAPIGDEELGRNRLLRQLSDGEGQRLASKLSLVDVKVRDCVYDRGTTIEAVYFPLDAVFSFVALIDDEVVVEVATIGNEGFVGLPVFLGVTTSVHAAFCQVPGQALRMSADDLRTAIGNGDGLRERLNRYTQAMIVQVAQNVACNRMHTTEERASRWLLQTHDRTDRDTFELTQEFLAQMLGVRRPTVSLTAGLLQSAGLIRYTRGQVSILDRERLAAVACDCYRVVNDEYDRLIGGA